MPYANVQAYRLLQKVQKQGNEGGYVWSAHFGCFVREAPAVPAVPEAGPSVDNMNTEQLDPVPAEESEEEVVGRGVLRSEGIARGTAASRRGRAKGKQKADVGHAIKEKNKPGPKPRGAPKERLAVAGSRKRGRDVVYNEQSEEPEEGSMRVDEADALQ
jgi:hypothetical protein